MPTAKTTRLKPLNSEASRIFKLCLDKERNTALQGLELAAALGNPLEGILDEVSINPETGELERGKRFTGNDKTQEMLDALLILQLGLALKGSPEFEVRNSIKKLSCAAPVIPNLTNFKSLQELELKLASEFIGEDVKNLGDLPKLRKLEFKKYSLMYSSQRPILKTLNGLNTPALEELIAGHLSLKDVSALSKCEKLKTIDLQDNEINSLDFLEPSLKSIVSVDVSRCPDIVSLKPLNNAKQLSHLDISGLTAIKDFKDIEKISTLKTLDFRQCENLQSLKGIPLKFLSNPSNTEDEEPSNDLYLYGLKSLISLKAMPPLSPEVEILSISSSNALKDLDGLESSTSLLTLKISKSAITDLKVISKLVNLELLEITNCDELVDASAIGELKKLKKVVLKSCKKLETLPDSWQSSITVLSLAQCPSLKPIKALPTGIDTKTIEIDNRRLLPRAKPVKALKSDLGAIWKLLSSREVANIQMGLELSVGVEEGLDTLYEGVSVKDGQLIRGKRFTGTGPAQPYLDLALLGLISRAQPKSTLASIREKITELKITLAPVSPELQGFNNLKSISLSAISGNTPDLLNFGELPSLTNFEVEGESWSVKGELNSLNGLNAPELKIVKLNDLNLLDISALENSSKIKQLNLAGNENLEDINALHPCVKVLEELNLKGCKQLKNIDALIDAPKLTSLDLNDCESIKSIKSLENCNALKNLNIANCSSLMSLEGVQNLTIQSKLYDFEQETFSLDGCKALTSLEYFPNLPKEVIRLSFDYMNSLKSFKGIRPLSQIIGLTASNSGINDLRNLCDLANLKGIDLSNCNNLEDVTPIGNMTHLNSVKMNSSGIKLMPSSWKSPVKSLELKNCKSLNSLGTLPASLDTLIIDGCIGLIQIDGMKTCNSLTSISSDTCTALSNLGVMPPSLLKISLLGCSKLKSLSGLEACNALQSVAIPVSIADASALKNLEKITVKVNIIEITSNQNKKEPAPGFSDAFINAMNQLKLIDLKLIGGSNYSSSVPFDLASIPKIKNLNTLDFSEYNFTCDTGSLSWLVQFKDLKGLWFYPHGSMSYRLKQGTSIYDTPGKIKKLQLSICTEAKLPPPAHLID